MARTRLVRGTLYITSGIMTGFCSRDLLGRPIFSTFMNERSVWGRRRRRRNLVILFPPIYRPTRVVQANASEEGIFRGIRASSERMNYIVSICRRFRFVNLIR